MPPRGDTTRVEKEKQVERRSYLCPLPFSISRIRMSDNMDYPLPVSTPTFHAFMLPRASSNAFLRWLCLPYLSWTLLHEQEHSAPPPAALTSLGWNIRACMAYTPSPHSWRPACMWWCGSLNLTVCFSFRPIPLFIRHLVCIVHNICMSSTHVLLKSTPQSTPPRARYTKARRTLRRAVWTCCRLFRALFHFLPLRSNLSDQTKTQWNSIKLGKTVWHESYGRESTT
jgi:hypothetical protein